MTEDALRESMRERFKSISAREWCAVKGVNPTHVSDFMRGKRSPPNDLLAALSLRVDYVKIRRTGKR